MQLFYKICPVLLVFALFFSCRKPTTANWDIDAVLPLVNGHLTITNFVGDSIFKADSDGMLNLDVTREITSIKLDSLIRLPDTTIVQSYTIPAIQTLTLAPGQALTFFPASELSFNISNGVALKRIDVREGKLNVKFSNTIDQPLDIIYQIPSATFNGSVLTIRETVPPGTNSLIKSYDLSNYSLSMRGLSGMLYNTIVQSCTVSANANAGIGHVNYGNGVFMEVTYQGLVPQYITGYFGQQTLQVPLDTAQLNLVNNFHASNFMFSDATLNFKILNEFGAEFSGGFSNIISINSYTNAFVPLTTSQLSNININRATLAGGQLFPSIKTVSLNSSNSNIVPVLSNLPDKLTYKGSIDVNPLGNISGYNDFAFYDKGIHVLADITIPMRFRADNFRLQSNALVDFANVGQLKNVKSGNIVLQAKNGYPFRAQVQAYLLDGHKRVIDSLFVPGANTVASGQLDSQNKVIAQVASKVLVPIDADKLAKLKRTKSIQVITYFLLPPNPPDIRLYEDYTLDVNIIAELTYNVKR